MKRGNLYSTPCRWENYTGHPGVRSRKRFGEIFNTLQYMCDLHTAWEWMCSSDCTSRVRGRQCKLVLERLKFEWDISSLTELGKCRKIRNEFYLFNKITWKIGKSTFFVVNFRFQNYFLSLDDIATHASSMTCLFLFFSAYTDEEEHSFLQAQRTYRILDWYMHCEFTVHLRHKGNPSNTLKTINLSATAHDDLTRKNMNSVQYAATVRKM